MSSTNEGKEREDKRLYKSNQKNCRENGPKTQQWRRQQRDIIFKYFRAGKLHHLPLLYVIIEIIRGACFRYHLSNCRALFAEKKIKAS